MKRSRSDGLHDTVHVAQAAEMADRQRNRNQDAYHHNDQLQEIGVGDGQHASEQSVGNQNDSEPHHPYFRRDAENNVRYDTAGNNLSLNVNYGGDNDDYTA